MAELVKWIVKPERGNFCIQGLGSEEWGDLYAFPKGRQTLSELFGQFGRGFLSMFTLWKDSRTRDGLVAPRLARQGDPVARWIAYDAIPWVVNLANVLSRRRSDRIAEKPQCEKATGTSSSEKAQDEQVDGQLEKGESVQEKTRKNIHQNSKLVSSSSRGLRIAKAG